MTAPEITVTDDNVPGVFPIPPLLLNANEYWIGIHSGYNVTAVPPVNTLSRQSASTVTAPMDSETPVPSIPVFHPAISYPVLVKDGDGRVMVVPMVILFSGPGAEPTVFSVLNMIEYSFTVHLG